MKETVMWHTNHDVNLAIENSLANLAALGLKKEAAVREHPEAYITSVATHAAALLATIPAVQRAMKQRHPALSEVERYSRAAGAIARLLVIDEAALVAHLN